MLNIPIRLHIELHIRGVKFPASVLRNDGYRADLVVLVAGGLGALVRIQGQPVFCLLFFLWAKLEFVNVHQRTLRRDNCEVGFGRGKIELLRFLR